MQWQAGMQRISPGSVHNIPRVQSRLYVPAHDAPDAGAHKAAIRRGLFG